MFLNIMLMMISNYVHIEENSYFHIKMDKLISLVKNDSLVRKKYKQILYYNACISLIRV